MSPRAVVPTLVTLLLAGPLAAQPGPAVRTGLLPPDPLGTLTFTAENDLFGGGTDRYYSNGVLLSYRSPSADLPAPIAWIDRQLDAGFGPGSTRWGISLGQNLYTPQDKYINPPDPRDRPYAAHLYAALSLDRSTAGTQTIAELQLGVVGPSALGEEVQNNYHRLIRVRRLDGWDSQLRDEPTANLLLERRWRVSTGALAGLETELIPSVVGTAGNAAIYAGLGGTARIGRGLDADWGPPRIRPAVAGSAFFQPTQPFGYYAFAGIDGRYVVRDIFLDGNTFRSNTLSVSKRPFVGEARLGAAVFWRSTRIAYTQVVRSEEFYGQKGTQTFGSLSASFRF